MPWTVAEGRIKGVLKGPLGGLAAGSAWSGEVRVVWEYGVYVVYCSYTVGSGAGTISGSESAPLIGAGGDSVPAVLNAAMHWASRAVEASWPLRVTDSEWFRVREDDSALPIRPKRRRRNA